MDRKNTPQENDNRIEEPSIPPATIEQGKQPELVEDKIENVEAKGSEQEVEEVGSRIDTFVGEKVQNEQTKELVGGPAFPGSTSSPLSNIDNIVDKHLGDFSSEIQLLLKEEQILYNFPQSPHSTSKTETTIEHVPPQTTVSEFSHYVSFYNPCPPVQDYVHSLQDSINGMLVEFERSPSHKANAVQADADAALASSVSAFVAGIRAANDKNDKDDEVSESNELTATDGSASAGQTHLAWQPNVIKQLPGATNSRSPPVSCVTLSVSASASHSADKPINTANIRPPPVKSEQSQWQPQQSQALTINRTVPENVRQTQDTSVVRTVHCATVAKAGSGTGGSKCEVALSLQSSEPVSSSASLSIPGPVPGHGPPATALSSLISQLQPEVFSSLVEIIKDVKRNSLQFYLHSTDLGDQVHEDVKVTREA